MVAIDVARRLKLLKVIGYKSLMEQLTLIDHYDSFTFNVIEWLTADSTMAVRRIAYDDDVAMAQLLRSPTPLVLSPGPKRPEDAAETVAIVRQLLGKVPIFGVCLGHQVLGWIAGASIDRCKAPFHGSARAIHTIKVPASAPGTGAGGNLVSPLFRGCPDYFQAAVYHSLIVNGQQLTPPWRVAAVDDLDEVQAIERIVPGEAPAFGVQFHPESYLSEQADRLRSNWLAAIQRWRAELA